MNPDQDNPPTAPAEQGLPPEVMLEAMATEHQAQTTMLQQRCATLYANVLMRDQQLAAMDAELRQAQAELAELRGANASPDA